MRNAEGQGRIFQARSKFSCETEHFKKIFPIFGPLGLFSQSSLSGLVTPRASLLNQELRRAGVFAIVFIRRIECHGEEDKNYARI